MSDIGISVRYVYTCMLLDLLAAGTQGVGIHRKKPPSAQPCRLTRRAPCIQMLLRIYDVPSTPETVDTMCPRKLLAQAA
jgi:hypothetical protein